MTTAHPPSPDSKLSTRQKVGAGLLVASTLLIILIPVIILMPIYSFPSSNMPSEQLQQRLDTTALLLNLSFGLGVVSFIAGLILLLQGKKKNRSTD